MTLAHPVVVRPDAVYATLRDKIIDQSVPPGASLTESAVAVQFGVSRPTAKLALERLVVDGLLRRSAHSTARVPTLTRDDIADLYENRAIVEQAAVSDLARAGAVPAEAVAAQRRIVDLIPTGEFARDDIAFHRALVAGNGSARLARMHALLMGEVELCIGQVQVNRLMDAADVAGQHQRILDAIVAGDPEEAGSLARQHVEGARTALLTHLDARHGKA